ncbi:MAG TPA: helix-turn-helix domain-containing protein [Thermoanaerobaculia bacterium]|jgi:AcrR family transcriptional regulator|nr:helix-turn-helix domain-containing protein [Thermoanaerobaculia bacterium]
MATRGRGRPRRPEADAEILDAALAMLRAGGYRELSLDEVARRAGTAKSSIYRRWPSKAALAAEVVRREVAAPEGDAVAAFAALMNGPFGGIVASLIGEAQESAETRSIVSELLAQYRAADDDALGPILFRRLLNN